VTSAAVEDLNEVLRSLQLATLTLDEQRAAMEAQAGAPPDGLAIAPVDAGGIACEWITASGATTGTVVSLRGGGYCVGSLATNRRFCGLLADVTGARVLNVGYRNAPEHPFPAALDDATGAYRWLVRTGAAPDSIAVVGNSAGGGLVLAALLALRDAGDPLPAAAVAISPWTDLAATGASITSNAATEVLLEPSAILDTAQRYAGSADLRDPLVSPLYGDLHGFPPLLLHVSGTEILRDDSVRFADRARAAGVDVTIDVVAGMPHVWHLFAGLLPEADDSLVDIGVWLADRLA
jgi:monoterpene epsilon-lactone hydrolase